MFHIVTKPPSALSGRSSRCCKLSQRSRLTGQLLPVRALESQKRGKRTFCWGVLCPSKSVLLLARIHMFLNWNPPRFQLDQPSSIRIAKNILHAINHLSSGLLQGRKNGKCGNLYPPPHSTFYKLTSDFRHAKTILRC